MPTHWTYGFIEPGDDLEQGDILSPTQELLELFQEVHPHFSDQKYLAYFVTTQSCDLVRRGPNPKASYISLGVVRPLAQVIPKLFSQIAKPAVIGVYSHTAKTKIHDFLQRLFNQNEQALGLFYLHGDSDSGIAESSVGFLRVTISVRPEHYDKLVAARVGRLNVEYRSKLGWLLGNLYARPDTRDWEDYPDGADQYKKLVKFYLVERSKDFGIRWVEDEIIQEAARLNFNLTSATDDEIEGIRPIPSIQRAVNEVEQEMRKIFPDLDSVLVNKLRNRLINNGKLLLLLKK